MVNDIDFQNKALNVGIAFEERIAVHHGERKHSGVQLTLGSRKPDAFSETISSQKSACATGDDDTTPDVHRRARRSVRWTVEGLKDNDEFRVDLGVHSRR